MPLIHGLGAPVPVAVESLLDAPARFDPRARHTLDRSFADQGTPLRVDLARSGAASITVRGLTFGRGG